MKKYQSVLLSETSLYLVNDIRTFLENNFDEERYVTRGCLDTSEYEDMNEEEKLWHGCVLDYMVINDIDIIIIG